MKDGTGNGIEKICGYCGIVFQADRKSRKYCCRSCAMKARSLQDSQTPGRAPRCENCGAPITSGPKNKKYCSLECCHESQMRKKAERRREERESLAAIALKGRTCAWCKKKFDAKHVSQKYCGNRCKGLAWQGRPKKKTEQEFTWTNIVVRGWINGMDPEMHPKLGKPYRAKKIKSMGKGGYMYIIPEIGKYGVLIRREECKEI